LDFVVQYTAALLLPHAALLDLKATVVDMIPSGEEELQVAILVLHHRSIATDKGEKMVTVVERIWESVFPIRGITHPTSGCTLGPLGAISRPTSDPS
jgi:hypothetical protein